MGQSCCRADSEGSPSAERLDGPVVKPLQGDVVKEPMPRAGGATAAESASSEAPVLEVLFGRDDGSTVPVKFTAKPLGFDFAQNLPLTLRRVKEGSVAQKLGVQSGWYVIAVNGEDMKGKTFDEIFDLLQTNTLALPKVL